MAGLQRSNETFRRSGSSGLVWEDRFLDAAAEEKETEKPKKAEGPTELRILRSAGSVGTLERSRSNGGGGGGGHGYRAGGVSPTTDPPSPKLSGCGFCGVFGKEAAAAKKGGKPCRRRR